MPGDTIPEPAQAGARVELLDDQARQSSACQSSAWEWARAQLDGLPGGRGLNIAHEAVDRHAAGPRADVTALRWVGKRDQVVDISYAQLRDLTGRFANGLGRLGVGRTERVFTLLGRVPELYVAALGALKAGCVLAPLLSAFGPEPVRQRLQLREGSVLVTTPALYHRHLLRDHRSAQPRDGLVHRTHRDPDAHAARTGPCCPARLVRAAVHRQRRRAAQRRGGDMGQRGARAPGA
jgi:acetyl-CoA synthetase